MRIVADTHLHIHPRVDAAGTVRVLARNLASLAGETGSGGSDRDPPLLAAFLVERNGESLFRDLAAGSGVLTADWRVRPSGDDGALWIETGGGPPLLMVAGRQIATGDGLEILSLAGEEVIPDRLPVEETIDKVIRSGALPILPWSPGKWLFRRRSIVTSLLDRYGPRELFVGDIALRPTASPEPGPMKRSARENRPVLAGSDPLPMKGEERRAGSYATLLEGEFDREHPVSSFHQLFREGTTRMKRVGNRCGLFGFLSTSLTYKITTK